MRRIFALAAAILAAAGIAALVIWLRSEPTAAPDARPQAELRPDPPPPNASPPPATAEDIERLVALDAQRSLHATLKSAFEAGKPLARSRERLQPVLKRLWPGSVPSWAVECHERVCRIEVRSDGPPAAWRSALQGSSGFAALADRLAWDPDGQDPAAYALLSQEGALDGTSILKDVERQVLESPALRRCLSDPKMAATLEYDLEIDDTGITFRRGGDVHSPLRPCFEDVLSEVISATRLPEAVHASRLKVSVRAGR